MGTKNNPGTYDCFARAEPDEPMFVLLGRDLLAPMLVTEWAARREHEIATGNKPESDRAMVAEARQCAEAMYAWRRTKNDSRCKRLIDLVYAEDGISCNDERVAEFSDDRGTSHDTINLCILAGRIKQICDSDTDNFSLVPGEWPRAPAKLEKETA